MRCDGFFAFTGLWGGTKPGPKPCRYVPAHIGTSISSWASSDSFLAQLENITGISVQASEKKTNQWHKIVLLLVNPIEQPLQWPSRNWSVRVFFDREIFLLMEKAYSLDMGAISIFQRQMCSSWCISLPAPYNMESHHTAYAAAAALLNVHPNSDMHETHSTHDSSYILLLYVVCILLQ